MNQHRTCSLAVREPAALQQRLTLSWLLPVRQDLQTPYFDLAKSNIPNLIIPFFGGFPFLRFIRCLGFLFACRCHCLTYTPSGIHPASCPPCLRIIPFSQEATRRLPCPRSIPIADCRNNTHAIHHTPHTHTKTPKNHLRPHTPIAPYSATCGLPLFLSVSWPSITPALSPT